jgi:hypothetical protein
MTRRRFVLLVLVALIVAGTYLALPPRRRELPADALVNAPVVRGTFHVHTRRSDGTGTAEEVAAAAGRAGLSFVILTDHGDGTRQPDAPVYLDGVLVIDAVEVSTDGGHVVALGAAVSPFPLGGEPRDVVEDIARLGGGSIVAHPGSPRPSLRWTEWTAPFDGLEWLNADSEWRDEGAGSLARAILTYPFRRSETLARLLDRPDEVIRRWDALLARRAVVTLAAGDAHASLGLGGEPRDSGSVLHLPSYEQAFRTFSIAVPRLALSGDAAGDAEAVITALLEGNVYSSVDALAAPAAFGFTATSSGIRVGQGGRLPPGQPVELTVETNAPAEASITLLKDGAEVAAGPGPRLQHVAAAGTGAYRVEVSLPGAPGSPAVPWLLSNPIYVRPPASAAPPRAAATQTAPQYTDGPAVGWAVEQSVRSKGAVDVVETIDGTEVLLRYALGGTLSEGPFVALTMPPGPLAGYDRLTFTARTVRPMRMSVQLRIPGGAADRRWHRSVYLDDTPREVTVPFAEMRPRGITSARRPDLSQVDAVLFVVDTVNSAQGASGQLWIDNVNYGR